MTDSELIDALGGTSRVSELCQVTTGAVSQWRSSGIPHARLMFLRLARPDVFEGRHSDSDTPSTPPCMAVIPVVTPERRAEERRDHERRDEERRDQTGRDSK